MECTTIASMACFQCQKSHAATKLMGSVAKLMGSVAKLMRSVAKLMRSVAKLMSPVAQNNYGVGLKKKT